MVSNHRKYKTKTRKSQWSADGRNQMDKVETDYEKVNLKNDGPTFFKGKSICMKEVIDNA